MYLGWVGDFLEGWFLYIIEGLGFILLGSFIILESFVFIWGVGKRESMGDFTGYFMVRFGWMDVIFIYSSLVGI